MSVRFRREADIAERDRRRLNWAESAPTGVASGKTGVRAIAVVPWQREIALTAVRGSSRSGGGREARCVSQRAEPTPGRLRARARAQL